MGPVTRAMAIVAGLALCTPGVARAGMPTFNLTDAAQMRVQTISFFLAGLLGSAWFVQILWNLMRRDFSWLPRLSYGKALAVVGLWGLLFVLVLTMISGARELMTPGAWEKQGFTYRLAKPAEAAMSPEERERQKRLDRLRGALWSYAEAHQGRFPESESNPELLGELWVASESPRARYRYVAGLRADQDAAPLVYEPGIHGDRRLVLLTNGAIQEMTLEQIVRGLPPEKP